MAIKSMKEAITDKSLQPRSFLKVLSLEWMQVLMENCYSSVERDLHFDLKKIIISGASKNRFLVSKLDSLVNTAFVGATSTLDELKVVGLKTLTKIIHYFKGSEDPEGGFLLEQYQTQMRTSLIEAFANKTNPIVQASAYILSATWICSGAFTNKDDLQNIQQLLAEPLNIINSAFTNFSELSCLLAKTSLLKSWALIRLASFPKEHASVAPRAISMKIVMPYLEALQTEWLNFLREYLLLTLSRDWKKYSIFSTIQNSHDANFREIYEDHWACLLEAASLSFIPDKTFPQTDKEHLPYKSFNEEQLFLIFALCIRGLALSNEEETIFSVLGALKNIFSAENIILTPLLSTFTDECDVVLEVVHLMKRLFALEDIHIKIPALEALTKLLNHELLCSNFFQQKFIFSNFSETKASHRKIFAVTELYFYELITHLPAIFDGGVSYWKKEHLITQSEQKFLVFLLESLTQFCQKFNLKELTEVVFFVIIRLLHFNESPLRETSLKNLKLLLKFFSENELLEANSFVSGAFNDVIQTLMNYKWTPAFNEYLQTMLFSFAAFCSTFPPYLQGKEDTIAKLTEHLLLSDFHGAQTGAVKMLNLLMKHQNRGNFDAFNLFFLLKKVLPRVLTAFHVAIQENSDQSSLAIAIMDFLVELISCFPTTDLIAITVFMHILALERGCSDIKNPAMIHLDYLATNHLKDFKSALMQLPSTLQSCFKLKCQHYFQGKTSYTSPDKSNVEHSKPKIQLKTDFSNF
ncbi:HEAT repeat-containing protein 5A-like [Zophobas morio]|uniref:HEAT repeat-containing protein 5A-like n=1 Tax=Zophobas morio TaxID=2755281 RepID=UPI003082F257